MPCSWLTTASSTWGSASKHFLTRASQCAHIMPSIFIVFSMVAVSFASILTSTVFIFLSRFALRILKKFRRSAFVTTQTLERLIAAAPNIGFSCQPKSGIHTPAASGMPITL